MQAPAGECIVHVAPNPTKEATVVIWNFTPPETDESLPGKPYHSAFHRGEATLVYAAIHGDRLIEPNLPSSRGDKALVVDIGEQPYDPVEDPPLPDWACAVRDRALAEEWDDTSWDYVFNTDGGSGYVLRFTGPVTVLWEAFYQAANRLDPECDPADYTPGGDDDTFDYYPDAFECLAAFAADLDAMDTTLAERGWERKRFAARNRIVTLVRNLYVAKGPFGQWEFEDYVKPYLDEAGLADVDMGWPKPLIPGTLMKEQ